MAYVSVPKDLTKVKNKVVFNLTKRQLICIGIGAAMGIPSYFLLRNVMGNSNAATVMVLLMLDLLIQVGLDDVKNKKIRKYSGGMKQRLGIAQAMINNPEILILDEPTVGLDPKERVKFRKLISSFASEKIVLLSTHIVSDIEYIADEIIILKKGRIENTGTIRYLLKDINKCVWECLVPEKEVNRIEQVYTVSNRKYGEDGVVLRLISREKPFANAKQVDPVLEDLYLFYFREGE